MSGNRKRYIFPSPVNPGAFRCITVYVPDDTIYLAEFWRAYEYFTIWSAWERDAAHTASEVAALWKVGFDQARLAFDNGECGEMAFRLRQSTTNPCHLEQSIDGGLTWTLAFDYSLCMTGANPLPGSDAPAADAAANLVGHIYAGIAGLLDQYPDCGDFVNVATQYMRQTATTWTNDQLLMDMCTAYGALTPEEKAAYQTECHYADVFGELRDNCDPDTVLGYFQCTAEYLAEWLPKHVIDPVKQYMDQVLQSLTGAEIWDIIGIGGIGTGADFASDGCLWEMVWSPEMGWGPVSLAMDVPYNGQAGVLEADGWHSVYQVYSDGPDNKMAVNVDASFPFPLHEMSATFDFNGTNMDLIYWGPQGIMVAHGNQNGNDVTFTTDIPPEGEPDCIGVAVSMSNGNAVGYAVLKRLSIKGSGPIPVFT